MKKPQIENTKKKKITPILAQLRSFAFWTLDTLKGSPVRKNLLEIEYILNNQNAQDVKKMREDKVRALLNHAVSTTPFYKSSKKSKSLSDFPVINKKIISKDINRFFSSEYVDKNNHKVTTSGSTGTPFSVYHNKSKSYRNTADTLFFSKKAGFTLGTKLFYLRLWNSYYKKSSLLAWLQNIEQANVLDLSNEAYMQKLITGVAKQERQGWLGYASGLEAICRYLDNKNASPIKNNITSIIAMSEALNNYTRESLHKYFGVHVVSRYSNVENGIIAQQCVNGGSEFYINWASYHIEILNFTSDTPVEYGELGRIVVTDLHNLAMPIIRYDTGDVGAIEKVTINGKQHMVFTKIEGRKMDMIMNTKGEIVSSFIAISITAFNKLKQIQLIQEDKKRYTIKLNVEEGFEDEVKVLKQYKKYLGQDAIINIDYVDEIPMLASGKRKATVNKYLATG